MAAHFVFVRFFLEYSDTFPFDRIANLKDDEVGPALEKLRKEWLAIPENQREFKRQHNEQRKRQEQWEQGVLAKPGVNTSLQGEAADGYPKTARKQPETEFPIDEVFALAGWGHPSAEATFPYGISRPYVLDVFDTKDLAASACEALQYKVNEVADAALTKTRLNDRDVLLVVANPRFFVVAEAKRSL